MRLRLRFSIDSVVSSGPAQAARAPRRGRHALLPLAAFVLALAVALAATPRAEAGYASIVLDAETGEVLHAVNADTRNYPASLTKMMTLYLVFEALHDGRLRLDQRLPVSRRAQGMTPSKLGLRVGQRISVEDAVLALVTKSANDAAVVLAEALAGTEFQFALDMTAKARELGMTRTRFRNASGLPNRGQLSTARDMARLARALLQDFPGYYDYFSAPAFRYAGKTYVNHNNLLDHYAGTDGIKTGYIRASGFNLVASVKRSDRRLIGVVFGGRSPRSRDRHMMTLLDRAFADLANRHPKRVLAPPAPKPRDLAQVVDAPQAPPPKPRAITSVTTANEAPPPSGTKPKRVVVGDTEEAEPAGRWAVQVGAYRSYAPARVMASEAARRAPHLLLDAEVSVSRIRGERGPLYRARLVGLPRARARQACDLLERIQVDCLVIMPRGGVEVALNNDGKVVPTN